MRVSYLSAGIVGLSVSLAMLGACQTESPGTKNVAGTYTAMVDSTPDKVTKAARKAVEEMKLTEISSAGSKVDGRVTARTAQDTPITINIERAGDNVSRVAIRVGATGDAAISKDLLDRIKDNLHWF